VDLAPGQGLGGAVGGNLLDTTLKATVNSESRRPVLPALPPSLRFSRCRLQTPYSVGPAPTGLLPAKTSWRVRRLCAPREVQLIRLAACTRVCARRNMLEEKKSEYRTTQSLAHEDSTVSPKKKSPVHTSMKIEPKSSRDRHVELAAAVGVKSPQVPASIQGPRALFACAGSVWEGAPAAGASATACLNTPLCACTLR
jgi:hypothetical protein